MTRRRFAPQPGQLAALATILVVALASLVLLVPSGGSEAAWVRTSYDLTYALAQDQSPKLVGGPIALVYLDLESYLREKQDPGKTWDRRLHAALVRRLTRAGARAVVFDVIFSTPQSTSDPGADEEFAAALREHGRVILAAELNDWSRQTGTTDAVATLGASPPYELFRNTASWGLASLRVDSDFTVRRIFHGHPNVPNQSLTLATLRVAGYPEDSSATHDASGDPAWVRYYGPPLAVPHVSYSAALRDDEVPDSFFHDRIVVIGAKPIVTLFPERRDEYRNPFSSRAYRDVFMPAVEVHAVQLLNLLRRDALHRLPPIVESVGLISSALGLGLLMFRLRPISAAGTAVVLELLLVSGVAAAFRFTNLWFPWLVVAGFQIPATLACGSLFHSAAWVRHRRQLEAARKAAEETVREQAALIDKAQDAILVQDLDDQLVYANPAALNLYGWPAAPAKSPERLRELNAPSAERLRDARLHVLSHGEWLGELEQATARGHRVLVQSRWTLIRDAAGQPRSILSINTDITEKKRLEAQFLRAQRMQTVGSLAGGMAHDLNNALAPVLMGAQILRRDESDPERCRLLEVMELNARRGADMVRQVLLFSRGTAGDRVLIDLSPLLREMERIARQTFPKNVRIALLAPPDLWPIHANATELHQILLNLCVNARDAMPHGGELSLSADNITLSQAEADAIEGGRPGDHVMLLVADTGHGIAPEDLPRVFEPFFSTKPVGQGTGLGLASVARIVQGHGGFVQLRSELGVGTTFEVYLPRALPPHLPPASQPPAPAADTHPRGHEQLILVADDERALRDVVAGALREQGYRVVTTADIAETIAVLRSTRPPVQLALVDHALPTSEGQPALATLATEFPETPFVWMNEDSAATPADGSSLQKPFGIDPLLQSVAQALHPRA